MIERAIRWSLDNRWAVFIGVAVLIIMGLISLGRIPIDAFPDLTNNQVTVIAEAPGMAPAEVEMLVTYPIEISLLGLPRTLEVRSISKLSLSMVTVVFEDDVNIYFARQLVNERLQQVRSQLPPSASTSLGPLATAFSEVYQYTVEGPQPLMERKTVHDWQIRPQLRTVQGVNEVTTWGGVTQQYHVEADPVALQRFGLTLRDLYEHIRDNNENFGGGYVEHAAEQYNVRGLGLARSIADIENIVLAAHAGTPVLVRHVATVHKGPMQRQGAVTRGGNGETVSGMVIALKGENGKRVIERAKERIARLALPEGMSIKPFYDQSTVIDSTIRTVRTNLLEGGALVILVLVLFLGNVRAALIVAAVIPLSMLAGFIGMSWFGVTANLMSLGAVDFGMIVDGAVVMAENSMRRLGESHGSARDTVREASVEVGRPILFGVVIIVAVYLPIFLLEGLEGRMFRPMAVTVCSALLGSLFLALFAVPGAMAAVLKGGTAHHSDGRWFLAFRDYYRRLLETAFRFRPVVLLAAVAALGGSLYLLSQMGTEFMPRLDEGSILIETRKLPGISVSESVRLSTEVERIVKQFPEVTDVVSKIGRPDLATEAMGVYQGDVYVLLKPRSEWKRFETKEQLIDALDKALEPLPGVVAAFTQPMAMRLDETISGVKADLAVKIFGSDPAVLDQVAERALRIVSSIPGAADAQRELTSGVAELRIEPDRAALARYGLNIADLNPVTEAVLAGIPSATFIDNQQRFDIVVRLSGNASVDAIRNLLLPAPGGERVTLGQVARVYVGRGPEEISRENGQRRTVVQANVRGRDLGSFVDEVRARMAAELPLPPGVLIDFGGQFENQERATRRLALVIPLTAAIIFAVLYATFHSIRQALLILLNVPFALIGGILALWMRDLNLNLSGSVGFIALFGVAVLNGIVLVSSVNRLREEGEPMIEAIIHGATLRLRPVLMTALVASLGFLPMATASSAGAEVQRPLATVVIGGLISSTLLTLLVLPLMYPFAAVRRDND